MDITSALLFVAFASLFVVLVRWARERKNRHTILKRYGIPGPEPHFLTGSLPELRKGQTPSDMITVWLKEYGDVFGYYEGDFVTIVLKDLDALKQVFIKDFNVFTNRPKMILDAWPFNKTIIHLQSKRWKEVRSVLSATFSSGKIKLMTPIVNKKVDLMVDVVAKKAKNKEMFDMYDVVQGLTLDVIADCALAMKTHCIENPDDEFLHAARDFFRFVLNPTVEYALMFPFVASILTFINDHLTAGKMTTLIVKHVRRAIAVRRQNPDVKSVDFLQLMLDHSEDDPKAPGPALTDDEIMANAYVFLLAGYETTATALAFTFYLLLKNPDIQERLYQEIKDVEDSSYNTMQGLQYLDQVFNESLRYYPPVTGFLSRRCEKDHQIGSVTIPKDANILAPVWDIHHDPELWPDPWKFDPERFSPENRSSIPTMAFLPFGVGQRNCIGSRFALLEAKLAIFKLIKRFRFVACEKTDDPLQLICPTVIMNPANGVYLRAVPRSEAK